jgi:hypothetical protein
VAEADAQPELEKLATSGPWHIYQVADSPIVEPLTVQPVVVNGREGDQRECWLELGTSWFQQRSEWAALPAAGGPDEWQRIDVAIDPARQIPEGQGTDGCGDPDSSTDRRVNIVVPAQAIESVDLEPITVSNVDIGEQSVSFDVSQVGVPVLVKVSYFPNWEVSGAQGPYRVAPNFMVVVPTSEHVELEYGRTTSDVGFYVVTLLGIVAAVMAAWKGPVHYPPADRPAAAGAGPDPDPDPDPDHDPLLLAALGAAPVAAALPSPSPVAVGPPPAAEPEGPGAAGESGELVAADDLLDPDLAWPDHDGE